MFLIRMLPNKQHKNTFSSNVYKILSVYYYDYTVFKQNNYVLGFVLKYFEHIDKTLCFKGNM